MIVTVVPIIHLDLVDRPPVEGCGSDVPVVTMTVGVV